MGVVNFHKLHGHIDSAFLKAWDCIFDATCIHEYRDADQFKVIFRMNKSITRRMEEDHEPVVAF